MTDTFRLTMAQLNPTVGDLAGNADRIADAWAAGRRDGADLVATPEMGLTGYQAQDLVLKPAFTAHCRVVLDDLAARCADGPALGVGLPLVKADALFNAYAILRGGRVAAVIRKHRLPNFTVFDERRLFDAGPIAPPVEIAGLRVGFPICEDAWHSDVCAAMAGMGAQMLVVPNGSPYFRGKFAVRRAEMAARVAETGLPVAYLNMCGGQDDQVFDGGSFVMDAGGAVTTRLPLMEEAVETVAFEVTLPAPVPVPGPMAEHGDELEQDWRVMVTALRDYCAKTGFGRVLLGLSGGVDSAAVAAVAADALGPEAVRCVMLPSEYTSDGSLTDAEACARALGVAYDTVAIAGVRTAVTQTLAPLFGDRAPDLTEENIQSRIRGLLLMALSNKFGEMLLTTGNKSEVAVGYATIYGDMSGGYNPLKDVYKTRLFDLCRWRNAQHRDWMMGPAGEVIPQAIIDKPPTAELREDQRDDQSLPPYDILDAILERLIDRDLGTAEVIAEGFDADTVAQVERLIYMSEYKRFQSAPGPRLSMRAFWLDRRYPIVNRWRDPGLGGGSSVDPRAG
ncbi:MAG: NAD+ synthase [Paracoccaceae bacterium]